MDVESIINAHQRLLTKWRWKDPSSWSEEFAIKRFLKKMEVPDQSREAVRREACFETYINSDLCLTRPSDFLPRKWYKARQAAHEAVRNFRLAPVVFTSGSEVKSTKGYNSIESKLKRSVWHCTPDCFQLWAETAYDCLAIKRATRKRFAKVMSHDRDAIRRFHSESWELYRTQPRAEFLCFRRMLSKCTTPYLASRFTTVRKNNDVDRPISVDGLCNMLVQRRIGNGIRRLLAESFGVDLNNLAEKHRRLIRDASKATIDLSNASDHIALWLVEWLFPPWFTKLLHEARAPYLEGLDGDYYVLQKVSSMGCGFTFELMTLIFLLLGREHDCGFSVFGDDMIVSNHAAHDLIEDLKAVGFAINDDKSFIDSEFRESCGANWHDAYGYIRSFDFFYPVNIHDCIVVHNKASLLGSLYPQFRALAHALARAVPSPLHGPKDLTWQQVESDGAPARDKDVLLSSYFRIGRSKKGLRVNDRTFSGTLDGYQLVQPDGTPFKRWYFTGFQWVPKLASKRATSLRMALHYAKYAMYLHGGRITPDEVTGHGTWQSVTWVQVGQRAFRVKSLVPHSTGCQLPNARKG